MPSTPHFETRTCPCQSSHYGGTCEQSTYSIRLVLLRTEHCPTGQYHIIDACLSVIPDRPRSRSYEPALTCKCKHRGRSELFRCILGWILGWICPRVDGPGSNVGQLTPGVTRRRQAPPGVTH